MKYVLVPAPQELKAYDQSGASAWERTYSYCVQKRSAIADEIARRDNALTGRKSWLLLIGGVATLGNGIYTGVATEPKRTITVPLIAISGSSLLSLLPSISSDDRLDQLRTKLGKLDALQATATNALTNVQQLLLPLGIEQDKLEQLRKSSPADTIKIEAMATEVETRYKEILEGVTALRTALVQWQAASQ